MMKIRYQMLLLGVMYVGVTLVEASKVDKLENPLLTSKDVVIQMSMKNEIDFYHKLLIEPFISVILPYLFHPDTIPIFFRFDPFQSSTFYRQKLFFIFWYQEMKKNTNHSFIEIFLNFLNQYPVIYIQFFSQEFDLVLQTLTRDSIPADISRMVDFYHTINKYILRNPRPDHPIYQLSQKIQHSIYKYKLQARSCYVCDQVNPHNCLVQKHQISEDICSVLQHRNSYCSWTRPPVLVDTNVTQQNLPFKWLTSIRLTCWKHFWLYIVLKSLWLIVGFIAIVIAEGLKWYLTIMFILLMAIAVLLNTLFCCGLILRKDYYLFWTHMVELHSGFFVFQRSCLMFNPYMIE